VFSLYDSPEDGELLYAETATVEVEHAVFTHYLGSGSGLDPEKPLDLGLFRDRGAVYLGIKVGDDEEARPRLLLGSAPFAAFAQYCGDAETLGGQPRADLQARVANGCSDNQAISSIGENGEVGCVDVAGGGIAGVSTGEESGLTGGCDSGVCDLGLDFTRTQRRVSGS
jgi:hypothetical protein